MARCIMLSCRAGVPSSSPGPLTGLDQIVRGTRSSKMEPRSEITTFLRVKHRNWRVDHFPRLVPLCVVPNSRALIHRPFPAPTWPTLQLDVLWNPPQCNMRTSSGCCCAPPSAAQTDTSNVTGVGNYMVLLSMFLQNESRWPTVDSLQAHCAYYPVIREKARGRGSVSHVAGEVLKADTGRTSERTN